MKLISAFFFVIVSLLFGYGQQLTLLTTLHESIKESSGLIYFNQLLITHNDSGGEAALYEIDSVSGNVSRKVVISNAANVDWEEICFDENYLYIGDFGNNSGSREDLKIYRVSISDYFSTTNDQVTADVIRFSYSDQIDFSPTSYATNFDAEAFISYHDSLYIFTKNWGDHRTNIYAVPKTPGTFQIKKIDSINSQGLVTGSCIDPESNTIMLIGYTFVSPFIIEISGFNSSRFSGGTIKRNSLSVPSGYSIQTESIAFNDQNQLYITAEESGSSKSVLYRLDTNHLTDLGATQEKQGVIYPNPGSDVVHVNYEYLSSVAIYDLKGVLHKTSNKAEINISDLPKGIYIAVIKEQGSDKSVTKKLIIQ